MGEFGRTPKDHDGAGRETITIKAWSSRGSTGAGIIGDVSEHDARPPSH